MKIDVLTLFPGMFPPLLTESIVGTAIGNGALRVRLIDIRDFAFNRHRTVDDYPYGGGAGMVLKPEPIAAAIGHLRGDNAIPVVYFTPQGRVLTQDIVVRYSREPHVIILCGHYKEIDQRIRDKYVTDELSVGDYVLSGGELPAMILIDAVARLQEGVLNDIDSAMSDSHQNGLLGCPHYTRPPEFEGMGVPEVLTNGNHALIEKWRNEQARRLTEQRRPDLLRK